MPTNLQLGFGLGAPVYEALSPAPGLDLNFSVDPVATAALLTTTRASVGYSDDTSGNWTSFLSNIPRITNKGLLVEEARTNSIRNNSMQGLVAGSPGTAPTNWITSGNSNGLVRTLTAAAVIKGVDTFTSNVVGTAASAAGHEMRADANTQIAATPGQVWSASWFLALTAGSMSGVDSVMMAIIWRNAGGTTILETTVNIRDLLTSSLTRFALTDTAPALTAFVQTRFFVFPVALAPIDYTLRVGWPQLELGTFVTSPIRTTTVAAARAADRITVTTSPGSFSTCSFGGIAEFLAPITYSGGGTSPQTIMNVSAAAETDRMRVQRSNTNPTVPRMQTTITNVSTNTNGSVTWAQNTVGKLFGAFAPGDQAISFNGGAVSIAAAAAIPTVNTVNIGSQFDGGQVGNCYIKRVALWLNVRLSNSDLQRIAA